MESLRILKVWTIALVDVRSEIMWIELVMLGKGNCPVLGSGLDDLIGIIDLPCSLWLKTYKMNNGTLETKELLQDPALNTK